MRTLSFARCITYEDTDGIEVEVSIGEIRFRAKLDTGATDCIFRRDYAELLGLDLTAGERRQFRTANSSFTAFGHALTLECLDWREDLVAFFADIEGFSRNVIGRTWLQRFRIGIIDYDRQLLVSHHDDE